MFTAREFTSIKEATEHIKKILAELETPKSMEFQIVHSISETECEEDGGLWEKVGDLAHRYLKRLDSQQGYMAYDSDEDVWDFLEWEQQELDDSIYKPCDPDELFVFACEGLVVLHNEFALCENQFPVVVVKKTFWDKEQHRILELLKFCEIGCDYTSKISPAIYVELFFEEETKHEEVSDYARP